MENHMAERGTL